MRFTCSLCSAEKNTFSALVKHHRHGHTCVQKLQRNVNGCQKLHKTVRADLHHIKCKHEVFWVQHCTRRNRNQYINDREEDDDIGNDDDGDDFPGLDNQYQEPLVNENHEVSSFLLGLREEFKTTTNACSYVANGISDIMKSYREDLNERVKEILQRGGANLQDLNQLGLSTVLEESKYEKAFSHFSEDRQINKFAGHLFKDTFFLNRS